MGKIQLAKDDLKEVHDNTANESTKRQANRGLQDLKQLIQQNKQREKEAANRMFKFPDTVAKKSESEPTAQKQSETPDENQKYESTELIKDKVETKSVKREPTNLSSVSHQYEPQTAAANYDILEKSSKPISPFVWLFQMILWVIKLPISIPMTIAKVIVNFVFLFFQKVFQNVA